MARIAFLLTALNRYSCYIVRKKESTMRKYLIIVCIVVIGLLGLSIIKDQAIRVVTTVVATQVTGAPVRISGFSLGILNQHIRISGLKMYNPKGFSGTDILIDLPKVAVYYDLFSLIKGRLHLKSVDVELKEIGLAKNKEGRLNVDSLKIVEESKTRQAQGAKASGQLAIQIDLLNLQMGRIVSKDYTVGREPTIQVYDINLKKSYKNITSVQQLAVLIFAEPMKQAGIKGAGIYGLTLLTGVGALPVAVIATFAGKDSIEKDFNIAAGELYDLTLSVLRKKGKIQKEDKVSGAILAQVDGVDVKIKLKALSSKSTKITISARKFMLPKPAVASGVLYHITEQVK